MVPVRPELKGGRYGTPSATIRKVPANWDELVTLSLCVGPIQAGSPTWCQRWPEVSPGTWF